uniref:Uncharacterized protein n=1 Tax=Pyrodinium bahamense TaxID=73915 RepID=A0A7S0F9Q2_9DINO
MAHAQEIESLRALSTDHAEQISRLFSAHGKVVEAEANIQDFASRLSQMDQRLHETQMRAVEERDDAQLELASVKTDMHRNKEHLEQHQRGLNQAAADIERLQAHLKETEQGIPERLDESRRQANIQKCELEAKIRGLELQHTALTDQLWGEEMGLARVAGEMRRAGATLEEFRGALRELEAKTVRPEQLSRVQEDVTNQMTRASAEMASLKIMVGDAINDVKEHLQTGLQAAATHYAAFAGEVRSSYKDEIVQSRELRTEVKELLAQFDARIGDADKAHAEAASSTAALIGEQREALEQVDLRRKGDRADVELELKAIRHRVGILSDSADAASRACEQLTGVSGMMLEATQLQCALEVQDTADREHLCLLGLREEAAAPPPGLSSPQAPANPAASPGKSPRRVLHKGRPPIMSVDQRCLSCSGQARTVLSAFKIACLQYNPSPVSWEDKEHSRVELLDRAEKLLEKARATFSALLAGSRSASSLPSPRASSTDTRRPSAIGAQALGMMPFREHSSSTTSTWKAEDPRRLPSISKISTNASGSPASPVQAAMLS